MTFILWIIAILLLGFTWGALMGVLLPGILGLVLSAIGGGLIGWYGIKLYWRIFE